MSVLQIPLIYVYQQKLLYKLLISITMAESKEAMQNTIKNLQAKSQYINKLEDKGSKTIVLQLGSSSIKMGFANEKAPFNILPCIAYKASQPQAKTKISEEEFDYEWFKTEYQKSQALLKTEGIISQDNRPFKGKPRAKQVVNIDRIPDYNQNNTTLYGEEALRVEQNPNWIFRKVITHGVLNISSEQDEKQKISDLENLLIYLLKNKIKIPEKEWSTFNCIVVVPDIFVRRHIKMLVYSLFSRIGFRKLYLHLESIMACFGTAVSSACVVDIGHEKINICCVDEGVIIPRTLVRKNFGSKDISKILAKIFSDRITDANVGYLRHNTESDLFHMDKIKQIACAIRDPEETINRLYEINPIRNNNEVAVQIAYTDSICIASNSFFNEIWNAFEMPLVKDPFDLYSRYYDLAEDPEDYFEQFSGGGHIYELGYDMQTFDTETVCAPFIYQPIEELILASLLSIKDVDVRKKFMSSILIIGGGAHLPKLSEEIILRLNKKLDMNGLEDKVEIATDLPLREIAPIHASWLGGGVIPKLDSLRDLWIERGKFLGEMSMDIEQEENALDRKLFTRKQQSQEWGIRYLKEKVPFIW